mmetsp:Transcript_30925/g.67559  ORF Transcript_30925/g.67559 Transcript_30925/m.67559 type:complete len:192 (-) Transcript_30925:224-799(-)
MYSKHAVVYSNVLPPHSPVVMQVDAIDCKTPRPAGLYDTGDDDSPCFASDEVNVLQENEMRGTPGGTVQSYKEVIDSLRKDNSNLKLKLYFMENVMAETTDKLSKADHPGLPEHERDGFLHKNVELRIKATELERRLEMRTSQKNLAERSLEELEASNRKLQAQVVDMGDEIALLRSTLSDVQQVRALTFP